MLVYVPGRIATGSQELAKKRAERKKGGKVRCTEKWRSAGGERDPADV